MLRIPCSTMFDYEWATVQHTINCRLAQAVVVPEAIPPERLDRYGARRKLRRYPGPEGGVLPRRPGARSGGAGSAGPRRRPSRSPWCARRPWCRSTTGSRTICSARLLTSLRDQGQIVVLPRTEDQRAELLAAGGFVVPGHAIDAPSLVALADLVVSAGGTMNREAVALGTPVWTTFEGRLGAVDERLIAEGRLRRIERPRGRRARAPRPRGRRPNACGATRSCSWTCCAVR